MAKKAFCVLLCFVLFAAHCKPTAFAEEYANDITAFCTVTSTDPLADVSALTDGSIYTGAVLARGGGYLEIGFAGRKAQGIYIKWDVHPGDWQLLADAGDSFGTAISCGQDGLYQEYVALPENTSAVRLMCPSPASAVFSAFEISVFGEGILPDSVHIWRPTPSNAELMVVSAHQDDELLFFGGTIPWYAGELNVDTVLIYLTLGTDDRFRIHEALEGLWVCGMRQSPVFLGLEDKLSESLDEALLTLDEKTVTDLLTGQLLAYRPQVVVSHDFNGEYGHGQHMLTANCLDKAVRMAADPDTVSALFPDSEPWTVGKFYSHLYAQNTISLQWQNMKITSLGGISAYQAACNGYLEHLSQHKFEQYHVFIDEEYDCRDFGLVFTSVGYDIDKNDFFENITPRIADEVPSASDIPEAFSPTGYSGSIFAQSDTIDGIPRLVRYGTADGAAGWYLCDGTGAIVLPARRLVRMTDTDAPVLDGVIPLEGARFPVYGYGGLLFRHGILSGASGWFLVDSAGDPILPAVPIDPFTAAEQLSQVHQNDDLNSITLSRVIELITQDKGVAAACICLAAATIIMTITAISVSSRKRRRRRRRRR